MRGWIVFAVVAAATLFAEQANADYHIVCYLGTWAVYRPDNGKYLLEDIDTTLCTHFVYGFVGLATDGGVKVLDTWNDLPGGKDGFRRFTALKAKNPNAKFMVAMGGWNEGSATYSAVMNDPNLRSKFIVNVVKFMKEYKFDGFDLDWEYPGQRGGNPYDKENYVLLIKEMRPIFDKEGFVLSAAVAAGVEGVDISYDVPALSKYLHFINVMTYDLHGPWEQVTGQNAPLYASSIDITESQKTLNVKAGIDHWIKRGADPTHLVMGMATYGHSFTLATSNSALGAPMSGPGQQGPYTRQGGILGYNEICEMQMQGGWTVTWDEEQRVPIAVKDRQWVGYDNVRSITEKVEYAMSMGLAGGMIWSLETDDFHNICGDGHYPLLTTINEVFSGAPISTTTQGPTTTDDGSTTTEGPTTTDDGSTTTDDGSTTTDITTETTSPSTTVTPPPHEICTVEGYVRDKEDCAKFYYCQLTNDGFVVYEYHCDPPLMYDDILQVCNYSDLVQC